MTHRLDALRAAWIEGSLSPAGEDELLDALRADLDLSRRLAGELRGFLEDPSPKSRSSDRIRDYLLAIGPDPRSFASESPPIPVEARISRSSPRPSATSLAGPILAGVAAIFAVVLIGGVAYVSHRQKLAWQESESAPQGGPRAPGASPPLALPESEPASETLPGLRATAFDRDDFLGPGIETVDSRVHLVEPIRGPDHGLAVRWEGCFLAEVSGDYCFLLSVAGRAHLACDGQDLVAEPRGSFHPLEHLVLHLRLFQGWHDLRVEYAVDHGDRRCELRYLPPGKAPASSEPLDREGSGIVIPARLFRHRRR